MRIRVFQQTKGSAKTLLHDQEAVRPGNTLVLEDRYTTEYGEPPLFTATLCEDGTLDVVLRVNRVS